MDERGHLQPTNHAHSTLSVSKGRHTGIHWSYTTLPFQSLSHLQSRGKSEATFPQEWSAVIHMQLIASDCIRVNQGEMSPACPNDMEGSLPISRVLWPVQPIADPTFLPFLLRQLPAGRNFWASMALCLQSQYCTAWVCFKNTRRNYPTRFSDLARHNHNVDQTRHKNTAFLVLLPWWCQPMSAANGCWVMHWGLHEHRCDHLGVGALRSLSSCRKAWLSCSSLSISKRR